MSDWIIVNIPYGRCYDGGDIRKELDSLKKRGLVKPGVQVRTMDGSKYLIGDINENRGTSDDFVEFDRYEIIEAYRVVFEDD